MIASSKWVLNSLDVKKAFLHGKVIKHTVYVRPPIEANINQIQKFQKNVYRLADAIRLWYLKLKEELIKLGALMLTLDKEAFIWTKEHKAIGFVACFVGILWGGNEEFSYIIKQLKCTFKIGAEHKEMFNYMGFVSNRTLTAQSYSIRTNTSTPST